MPAPVQAPAPYQLPPPQAAPAPVQVPAPYVYSNPSYNTSSPGVVHLNQNLYNSKYTYQLTPQQSAVPVYQPAQQYYFRAPVTGFAPPSYRAFSPPPYYYRR